MNHPEATQQALDILRSGEPFQWYVITLLALVVYVYFNEAAKKNWRGIAAGLSLYAVHWLYEIANALIQPERRAWEPDPLRRDRPVSAAVTRL
ncbi:MAG: hypothetical protein NT169_12120 [Chloroflexi bacterium]|nr:hypothetical protein [Chloroflexota bacterium]